MIIISDNSALSALAEINLLFLLPTLFGEVSITESVHRECQDCGAPEALRLWIASAPAWIHIAADPAVLLPGTANLGAGEASAISLAWEHRQDCLLILDEKRGRRVAAALGLPKTGVLAILADAANQGLVDFEEVVGRLAAVGFHMSESVISQVRARLR